MIVAPPLVDTRQPGADFRQIPENHSFQLVLQFGELRLQLLQRRDAADGEIALSGFPADVRESQKIE